MISEKDKFILFSVPETGEPLITEALAGLTGAQTNGHGGDPSKFLRRGGEFPHCSAATSIKRYFGKEKFDQFFKFAFVRNPWDRLVALYFTHKKMAAHYNAKGIPVPEQLIPACKAGCFSTWVKCVASSCKDQFTYLSEDGCLIPDYIGRFELLQKEFYAILQRMGFPRRSLPTKNGIRQKEYWAHYDAESIEIVGDIFCNDIAVFNYDFGMTEYQRDATPSAWGQPCHLRIKNLNQWCRIKDPGRQGLMLHPNAPKDAPPVVSYENICLSDFNAMMVSAIADDKHEDNPGAVLEIEVRVGGERFGFSSHELLPGRLSVFEIRLPRQTKTFDIVFAAKLRENAQSNNYSGVLVRPIQIL